MPPRADHSRPAASLYAKIRKGVILRMLIHWPELRAGKGAKSNIR